jgi:hypothetical protein
MEAAPFPSRQKLPDFDTLVLLQREARIDIYQTATKNSPAIPLTGFRFDCFEQTPLPRGYIRDYLGKPESDI